MIRNMIALLIVLVMGRSVLAVASDETSEMLARAEALYYEADFAKSVELLLRVDELLGQETVTVRERADVKLQLALGLIGLNDSSRAKEYLGELYALDADYPIDPQMFSPKVIRLADEARAEQNERRCRSASEEAQLQLERGNSDAVMQLIESGQQKCADLAALSPKVGDLFFKEGLGAYKKAEMEEALRKFRAALRLDPEHELAVQYADLTLSRLELAADRALLTWRKDFDAGNFVSAATDYRELVSVAASDKIEEARTAYRRALTALVDSWNQACEKDDTATMEGIRLQINALLPESSFAEDILGQMKKCTHAGCIQMNTALAIARLKTRVDPQFSSQVLSQFTTSPLTVRVKATIGETGDVRVAEVSGNHPFVSSTIRAAVEQWKFLPAILGGQARCIETEIPIVINWSRN